MESLSTKIDSALVEYMSEMDVYQTHLENLKNCFKEGFFHLGQAKYIMGASQLSQISYDSRMSASAVVAKPEVQQDDSETVTDLALALEFLEISRLQKKPKPAQDEEATEGNIRRRHKDTTSEKPTTDEEEKEPQPEESKIPSSKEKVDEDSVEEDVAPIRDPATWFGFLTPPALRETQTQFKRALNACISVANARQIVEEKAQKYEELLNEKEKLKETEEIPATQESEVTPEENL